jgi:hypothetical protein
VCEELLEAELFGYLKEWSHMNDLKESVTVDKVSDEIAQKSEYVADNPEKSIEAGQEIRKEDGNVSDEGTLADHDEHRKRISDELEARSNKRMLFEGFFKDGQPSLNRNKPENSNNRATRIIPSSQPFPITPANENIISANSPTPRIDRTRDRTPGDERVLSRTPRLFDRPYVTNTPKATSTRHAFDPIIKRPQPDQLLNTPRKKGARKSPIPNPKKQTLRIQQVQQTHLETQTPIRTNKPLNPKRALKQLKIEEIIQKFKTKTKNIQKKNLYPFNTKSKYQTLIPRNNRSIIEKKMYEVEFDGKKGTVLKSEGVLYFLNVSVKDWTDLDEDRFVRFYS